MGCGSHAFQHDGIGLEGNGTYLLGLAANGDALGVGFVADKCHFHDVGSVLRCCHLELAVQVG